MYADDTHTLILLIFIMSFTFVPWQIKCEKKTTTQQIVWPFSRLFMYPKGNQKPNSRSAVLPKKGSSKEIPSRLHVSDERFERLDNTYLTDTYTGNTKPLFHSKHLSFLHRHLYMDHIFSAAQFPDSFIIVSLIFPAQNYFQLQTECYF